MIVKFFTSYSLLSALLLVMVSFTACENNGGSVSAGMVNNPASADGKSKERMPVISFNKTEHDFGQLIQGEKVKCVFRFTNTGSADLILAKVSTSCGCTATEFPKEAIAPGAEGKIEITFDSGHQRGIQNKSITVLTNTQPKSNLLYIKAMVSNPETN